MLQLFPKRSTYRPKSLAPAPTVVLGRSAHEYLYLLATPRNRKWDIESWGTLKLPPVPDTESDAPQSDADEGQTWESLLAADWEEPSLQDIRNRRTVLCVQRPEIEFFSFPVMVDESEDLTEVIHNELILREKLTTEGMVIDYVTQELDPDQRQVFAAAVPDSECQQWMESARGQNRKLDQIFVRSLTTLRLVRELDLQSLEGSCLVLAIYGQQADLMLLHQRKPCIIRSLFLQEPDSIKASVAQLLSEIRLSISTIDHSYLDETLSQAVVLADGELATELIVQLKVELDISGTRVPIEQLPEFRCSEDKAPPLKWLPLLGALLMENEPPGHQTLDLANPKQPTEPPSMVRRVVLLSALLLMILGYFGMDWYDQYQANHQEMVEIVADARKDKQTVEKLLPDAQMVQYVQRWKSQEIQWLKQLQALTDQLPSGDRTVIRQLTGDKSPEGAAMSMQIHVSDLEVSRSVQQTLEESGLEIKLRRVVETSDPQYPFRLETTVLAPRITETQESETETSSDNHSTTP